MAGERLQDDSATDITPQRLQGEALRLRIVASSMSPKELKERLSRDPNNPELVKLRRIQKLMSNEKQAGQLDTRLGTMTADHPLRPRLEAERSNLERRVVSRQIQVGITPMVLVPASGPIFVDA